MALTINSNHASSIALRSLQKSQNALDRALSRLASGQNAPSARYDAAGVAVSSRIRAELVSLQKYQLNAQQGTSMLQVAEGAYQRAGDMLNRMRALAAQAQSSNLSATERGMLNTEYQQIKNEINRLARSVKFNDNLLFDIGSVMMDLDTTSSTTGSANAYRFVTADFNGDGIVDMIQGDALTGVISLSLGNGDGTFQASTTIVAADGFATIKLATGDFNGDGIGDIAVGSGSGVRLFTNNGSGQFTLYGTPSVAMPVDFAVGDLNGDGRDDIAVSGGTITLNIYLSSSTSAYNLSTVNSVVFAAGTVKIADFNNDGYLDIAGHTTSAGGQLAIATNSGSGSFSMGTAVAAALLPLQDDAIKVADVNNDGFMDIIIGEYSSDTIGIFRGTGNGTFQTASLYTLTGALQIDSLEVKDLNGDGFVDIVAFDSTQNALFTMSGRSVTTSGIISFNTVTSQVLSGTMWQVNAVDLNRDGRLDLLGSPGGATGRVFSMMNQTTMGLAGTMRVSSNGAAVDNVGFRAGSMRLNSLDHELNASMINSKGTAKRAELSIKRAMETLSLFRTNVGSAMNRLEKVTENIATMIENQEGARSAIADLDVAQEMSAFTAQKLVQQAGISMLTQANNAMRNIAKLLEGGAF